MFLVSSLTLGSLLLNVLCSVSTVLVNKWLVFGLAGFSFATSLTIIHFIVIFIAGRVLSARGYFVRRKLPLLKVLPLSFAFCGYVAFNNLSLLTNTVCIYQTSKILCTPVIVLIEARVYRHRERPQTLMALTVVCLGVFATFFSDTTVNFAGSFWAALAIAANSLYTIWGKTKQQELHATPMQLLLYQSAISAVLLLFLVLPLDGIEALSAYEPTWYTVVFIALSCVLAFGINFSFFLFVGQTSPLTTNVLGYLKTVILFVMDYLLGGKTMSMRTLAGITLTLSGQAWYTAIKIKNSMQGPGEHAEDDKQLSEIALASVTTTGHVQQDAFIFVNHTDARGDALGEIV